jgi:hypothetical protein
VKAVHALPTALTPIERVAPGAPSARRLPASSALAQLPALRPSARVARPGLRPERRRRRPVRLGPRARRTLGALGAAIGPSRDLGIDIEARVVDYVSRFGAYLPRPLPSLLGLLFAVLEWLPVLVGPRRGRLSRLPVADRRRFIHRLLHVRGPVRDLTNGVRGLLALAVYEQPEVKQRMGYEPQAWLDRKARERRERFGAPEPW